MVGNHVIEPINVCDWSTWYSWALSRDDSGRHFVLIFVVGHVTRLYAPIRSEWVSLFKNEPDDVCP